MWQMYGAVCKINHTANHRIAAPLANTEISSELVLHKVTVITIAFVRTDNTQINRKREK